MKIAIIYDAVYPWVKGGGEKRTYEISKRLVEMGHEVHWFGLKWWEGKNDIVQDGIYIHGIGKWDTLYVNRRRSISEALYFGIKTLTKLEGKFDVIDCQIFPYFSCFSAKFHSMNDHTPFVITWYEVWNNYWYEYLGKIGIFGKIIEKLVSKLPDMVIAISKKVKNDLTLLGIPPEKIKIIPDGIGFNDIQKVNASNKKYDIIYAGRLIKHKNVDLLLKATSIAKQEIPNIKVGIIGDGPEMGNLKRLTKELKLEKNVHFLGFLKDAKDVYSYMKSSKVFVFPSTREGAGLVTLEANACGLPVITVSHEKNAATEVVINGLNGFICNLSEEDIAEKILYALYKKRQMEKRCIEFAKRYDWDTIAKLTEKAYEEVLR
ncbi:glycosyltransferase family 4 protein [Thermococcus sp. SY098]|uniref:glycosyltransferase family 4 protein n=1 Tax=Thermococcus sp. SY098 TaxID=3111325 RepID=UPI002D772C6E|nr:glycosyltransferase family 4 protein [Thermococcus sp. SY098]WRS52144.1 glycosyltransferase family 4 protein [Thermococcus sp. SY098]